MPDTAQVPNSMPSNAVDSAIKKPEGPGDSPLGVYASFPWSPEPFAELSEKARNALMALDDIASKMDIAARRLEIEQTWEAC